MPRTTPFFEYESLIRELHDWHLNHSPGDAKKTDPHFDKIISRLEELESAHLSEDEIRMGDRMASYFEGYRDARVKNRMTINLAKDLIDECDADLTCRLSALQVQRHEYYEQGLDDYSPEVEKADEQIKALRDLASESEAHAADTFESYLIGYQHAQDRRPCEPDLAY